MCTKVLMMKKLRMKNKAKGTLLFSFLQYPEHKQFAV
jgi:hypothetical protein